MKTKTKKEAEAAKSALFSMWLREANLSHVPKADLDFGDFYNWLSERAPEYTRFRSVMGAKEDWERWFACEFGQTWKY